MENKLVHVNSYTKDDGTHVKEHYRGRVHSGNVQEPREERDPMTDCTRVPGDSQNPIGDCMSDKTNDPFAIMYSKLKQGANQQNFIPQKGLTNNLVLEGGVSTTVGGGFDFSNIGSALISAAMIAVSVGVEAAKIAAKMKNANQNEIKYLKPQMNNHIEKIKETQKISDYVEKMNLEKLVETKDKEEYANLYKTFTQQKELNAKNKQTISRIEYAAQNDDYETLINVLNTYTSNYDEVVSRNKRERPTNLGVQYGTAFKNSAPVPTPYINENVPASVKITPLLKKGGIDFGMEYYNVKEDLAEAKELWKASSHDFNQSKEYVQKNGNLIFSISELPSNQLQNIVSTKLQQQLKVKDALGIIFKPESSLSIKLQNSLEMKKHFLKFAPQLLEGEIIPLSSTLFESTFDLAKTFGHADILFTYIDKNKNLTSLVLDTYDFNASDTDWKVQQAHEVQAAGYLRNFYTINIVKVPELVWKAWLKSKK